VTGDGFPVPPGDPDELRAAAGSLRALAGQHDGLRASFGRHAAEAAEAWSGGFAARFSRTTTQVAGRFGPVCEATTEIALALSGYASELEDAQYATAALNRQAAEPGYHIDPLDGMRAEAQLGQQADDINERLGHAASVLAGHLSQIEHGLAAALPDIAFAEQLHTDIRRAVAGLGDKNPPSLWERTELPRQVLEWVLAPSDMAAGDHWVSLLKKAGEEREELFEDYDEDFEQALKAFREGNSTARSLIVRAADSLDHVGNRLEVWDAIAPRWVKTGARWASQIKGLSYGMSAAGILADAWTLVSPEDSGGMAVVDRSAAVLNAGALGASASVEFALSSGWIAADSAAAVIPGVGGVVIGVTGAYLAGDFIYHHRAEIGDVATNVGHAVVRADETLGRWEVQAVTDGERKWGRG
jgi:uncharacterized protein YukE